MQYFTHNPADAIVTQMSHVYHWPLKAGLRPQLAATPRDFGEGGLRFCVKGMLVLPSPRPWKPIGLASQVYLYAQRHSSALVQSHGCRPGAYSPLIDWKDSCISIWQQRGNNAMSVRLFNIDAERNGDGKHSTKYVKAKCGWRGSICLSFIFQRVITTTHRWH